MRIVDIYPVRKEFYFKNAFERNEFLNNYYCLTLYFDKNTMTKLAVLDMINEAITNLSTYNVNYDYYYIYDRKTAELHFCNIFNVRDQIKDILLA